MNACEYIKKQIADRRAKRKKIETSIERTLAAAKLPDTCTIGTMANDEIVKCIKEKCDYWQNGKCILGTLDTEK